MDSTILRWEPADRAWAQPGGGSAGQVEVLPVHDIQGLYGAVYSVAAFFFFTDSEDISLFTTVIAINHSLLRLRDQKRFKCFHRIPYRTFKNTDFSNGQDTCAIIIPDQLFDHTPWRFFRSVATATNFVGCRAWLFVNNLRRKSVSHWIHIYTLIVNILGRLVESCSAVERSKCHQCGVEEKGTTLNT